MVTVYLSLGSNLGDRQANLERAVELLGRKLHVEKLSSIYETEPVSYVNQPSFLNAVCQASTDTTKVWPSPLIKAVRKCHSEERSSEESVPDRYISETARILRGVYTERSECAQNDIQTTFSDSLEFKSGGHPRTYRVEDPTQATTGPLSAQQDERYPAGFITSPQELLEFIHEIESELGRVRSFPNAPRTVDIDILFYGDVVLDTPELTLPHPRLAERAFVLVPLAEIAPDLKHQVTGAKVSKMLDKAPGREGVRRCTKFRSNSTSTLHTS